jgi:hypothetical protein
MKKAFLFIALVMMGTMAAQAQGGGMQRRTPEERLKMTKEKLAGLKLDASQTEKSDAVFLDFYKAQNKIFEDLRGGGGQTDRGALREKFQKLADERDEKLKGIFNEDQFRKWKDEIEPSLRPQRRNGGRGRNN